MALTPKRIREWIENEDKFLKVMKDKSYVTRERRQLPNEQKPKWPEFDTEVLKWFKTQREDGREVHNREIQDKSLILFKEVVSGFKR